MNKSKLNNLFHYHNGKLYWKVVPSRKFKVGMEAGCFDVNDKYWKIKINYKSYRRHRLVYAFHTDEWPDMIDHKDGDKSNDKIENLRPSNASLNTHNSSKTWGEAGYRGVLRHRNKWLAQIYVNGKRIYLGLSDTPEEASQKYEQYKEEYVKQFQIFEASAL